MSKRSSSDGSRREGIVGEAAWEVKKSAGGGECRKRLLTPSSRIDTFLRAFCPSASRYVRDTPRMPISRLVGCSSLHARDLHSLFRVSFASDTRRLGREIAHKWNFNEKCSPRHTSRSLPLFPYILPRCICLKFAFFKCECIKKRASSEQNAIDFWAIKFFEVTKIGKRYIIIINYHI